MKIDMPKGISSVFKLYKHLTDVHKKKLFYLAIFMIFTTILEVSSLGLVIPFLGILTNESYISSIPFLNGLTLFFLENFSLVPTISISLLFILFATFSATARIALLKFNASLIVSVGSNLSLRVLNYNLSQPYDYHIRTNTSEIIANIREKVELTVFSVLLPILTFISNLIIAIGIIATLFIINWKIAITVSMIFIPIYYVIISFSKKKLNLNSLSIQHNHPKVIQQVQEALGSIRDIILNSNKDLYVEKYKIPDYLLRSAQAKNILLASTPRFILECVGMIMIALLALFFMKDNNNWQMVIPSLGALALGAQRVLPALQQVYAAWASIIGYGTSSEDVILSLDELALKRNEITNTDNKSINFKKSIIFKNISFTYSGTKSKIINELDFKILKGDNVAITGRTGDGKSTLLDIITGLLLPSSGDIFVDGIKLDKSNMKQWQKNIALVPQVIFLTDESIIKNVCLGVHPDLINLEKAKDCIKKVQLTDFIQNLPLQYDTEIGERGVRLSGGQRQRIGIARALYKDANLLILDEATNALDQKTEKMILNNIKKLRKDITIIIISHRPQTLTFCNKIISLNKAKR
tara:strand:- start:21016 stop:22761 length:1746 start_codon:yes stop_codon:yes gene_type:complete